MEWKRLRIFTHVYRIPIWIWRRTFHYKIHTHDTNTERSTYTLSTHMARTQPRTLTQDSGAMETFTLRDATANKLPLKRANCELLSCVESTRHTESECRRSSDKNCTKSFDYKNRSVDPLSLSFLVLSAYILSSLHVLCRIHIHTRKRAKER